MKKQNTFSSFIKHKRTVSNYTQQEIASFLGFDSPQVISNAERGAARLAPRHFKKLAKIFSVDVGDIITAYVKDIEDELRKTNHMVSK